MAPAPTGWRGSTRRNVYCITVSMEASIAAWLQKDPAAAEGRPLNHQPQPPHGAATCSQSSPRVTAPSVPTSEAPDGVDGSQPKLAPQRKSAPTVAPLQLPVKSSDPPAAASALPSSRTLSVDDGPAAPPTVCPLCHGVSADAEVSSPPAEVSPTDADSPSPPAGASPSSATGGSAGAGERVQRRALRKVKRGRSINKVGKWWKMYGYSGPPYCQRCSEVFRDHIIRQISNSANCSRASPCTDCTQVLNYLPKPHEDVWAKMDRTKEARGTRAPKQSKKSAAAVGLVQLSESYDGGEMSPQSSPRHAGGGAAAQHGSAAAAGLVKLSVSYDGGETSSSMQSSVR